jgi:hypothetical protein
LGELHPLSLRFFFFLFHHTDRDGSLIIGGPTYQNCNVIYVGEEQGNDKDPTTGLPLFQQSDFAFLFCPFPRASELPPHLYDLAINAKPLLPVAPPPPPLLQPISKVLDIFLVGFASPTQFRPYFPQNNASDKTKDIEMSRSDLYQLFKGVCFSSFLFVF